MTLSTFRQDEPFPPYTEILEKTLTNDPEIDPLNQIEINNQEAGSLRKNTHRNGLQRDSCSWTSEIWELVLSMINKRAFSLATMLLLDFILSLEYDFFPPQTD